MQSSHILGRGVGGGAAAVDKYACLCGALYHGMEQLLGVISCAAPCALRQNLCGVLLPQVLGVMHGVQQLLVHFRILAPAPGENNHSRRCRESCSAARALWHSHWHENVHSF